MSLRSLTQPSFHFTAGVVLAALFALTAVAGTSRALPTDVLVALTTAEPVAQEEHLIHVDGPPTGVARGIQFGLLALLVGGVPAAVVAIVVSGRQRIRSRQWSSGWANVFLAGFVFQVNSLMFTGFILLLILPFAYDSGADSELVFWAAALVLSLLCGTWGLRSWRTLQLEVRAVPTSISPARRMRD